MVAWGVGAGGADVSKCFSWTVLVRPLGRSNLYENEVCPDESVVCSTFFTIASTGPNHTVDSRQNICVGGGRRNAVGGFVGGSGVVYEVLGGVNISLVRFGLDVSFSSSILVADVCSVALKKSESESR